ncbi:hypothetical protein NT6N_13330 [Oceaniferula spumae]|uniref:Uncharacterized protein n=1 Tax=Oceaniferula spumae TaxID=2979115 RepID=A0AAT9FJU8_9BACT
MKPSTTNGWQADVSLLGLMMNDINELDGKCRQPCLIFNEPSVAPYCSLGQEFQIICGVYE